MSVPFRCGRPLSEGSGSSFLVPAGSLPHSIPYGVGRPPLHYTLWWRWGEGSNRVHPMLTDLFEKR
ncbi:hypothetical protein ANABIO32_30050 [Rossellomorea marisflavi]|nr:hypothetical protein ANABIO32_30050 [Rossellomorea marisflavi]